MEKDSDRAGLESADQTKLLQKLREAKFRYGLLEPSAEELRVMKFDAELLAYRPYQEFFYKALCDRLSPALATELHAAEHCFLRCQNTSGRWFIVLAFQFQDDLPAIARNGMALLIHHAFDLGGLTLITVTCGGWEPGEWRFRVKDQETGNA